MNLKIASEMIASLESGLNGWGGVPKISAEAERVSAKRAIDALCDFIRYRAERIQTEFSEKE